MPQLDTVYAFMIYLWTWLMLYLTTQKIKTFPMMNNPTMHTTQKTTPSLPWL